MTTYPAEQLVPRLRGQLHVIAFWGALVAAFALVALAPSGTARVACAIYGTALCALFAVSALYHRWRWSPRWRPLLRRLDHSTIHVFIAASTTPLAALVLDGRMQTFVLACAWVGALGGIALSLAWIDAPRTLVAASYVLVGWAVLAALPQLPDQLATTPLLLLAGGASSTSPVPRSTPPGARTRGRPSSASTRSSTHSWWSPLSATSSPSPGGSCPAPQLPSGSGSTPPRSPAPLGVAALFLGHGLGPEPEWDAQHDSPQSEVPCSISANRRSMKTRHMPVPPRRVVTSARWPAGIALTAWSYMWRTTPIHRRELDGSWPAESRSRTRAPPEMTPEGSTAGRP